MPYFGLKFTHFTLVFMGFWQIGNPFKYTRGERVRDTFSIHFHPIGCLGQASMKWPKYPFWTYFTGFGQNTRILAKIGDFPPKLPYFRLMTRAKSSKLTLFTRPSMDAYSYYENKVVRFMTPKTVFFDLKRVSFDTFSPGMRARKGDFDQKCRK